MLRLASFETLVYRFVCGMQYLYRFTRLSEFTERSGCPHSNVSQVYVG